MANILGITCIGGKWLAGIMKSGIRFEWQKTWVALCMLFGDVVLLEMRKMSLAGSSLGVIVSRSD